MSRVINLLRSSITRSISANSSFTNSFTFDKNAAIQPKIKIKLPRKRINRRMMAAMSGLAMFIVLPLSFFQVVLYRQNLAMADERLPQAPTFTSKDRLLVISPHCDDETLGVGGTLEAARAVGAQVRVVFMTNGDGSRSTQIAENARHPRKFLLRLNSFQKIARMRQRETVAALRELQIAEKDIIFLGYPDGGTQVMWEQSWDDKTLYRSPYTGVNRSPYENARTPKAAYCGSQVLKDITGVISEWRPTAIFTTHPHDTHPDHWAAYSYTRAALETLRLKSTARPWAEKVKLLTFLVHRGWWPAPHGYHPDARLVPPADLKHTGTQWLQAPLAQRSQDAKKSALERYVSQLAFTPQYLRGFIRRNELFGVVPVSSMHSVSRTPVIEMVNRAVKLDSLGSTVDSREPKPSLLVQDAPLDSLWYDVSAAADVQSLTYTKSPTGLTLQIALARSVSSRFQYWISLHTVTESSTSARRISVRWRDSKWRAHLVGTAQELPLRVTAKGFKLDLSTDTLQAPKSSYSLLVSASTYLGGTCFDQTATGTLRIDTRFQTAPTATHYYTAAIQKATE